MMPVRYPTMACKVSILQYTSCVGHYVWMTVTSQVGTVETSQVRLVETIPPGCRRGNGGARRGARRESHRERVEGIAGILECKRSVIRTPGKCRIQSF